MLNPDILNGFETISLEEMEKVRLMNRIDTKFVTHISDIERLLLLARHKYLMQQIDGQCNMPYYSCYFDTDDTDMFYQHQRGKKTRQKIRSRIYEGSDSPTFLEIKSKNNKGRTRKKRIPMEDGEDLDNYSEFLGNHSSYFTDNLSPVIENHFYRITLVNRELTERITIDTELEFHNFTTNKRIALPEIGIIEWKRDGLAARSELKDILLQLRIKEGSFSKYCIGMALTDSGLRQNRLKKKLRYISKIALPTFLES